VEELRPQLANDRAIRLVEAQAENLDDLLAGGATLEQLANETDMVLGKIDWTIDSVDEIAAYEAFRDVARAVSASDFPEIERLDDGGLFALRLDEVLPPRPAPFETVREEVLSDWQSRKTAAQLTAQVQDLVPSLQSGSSFADLNLDAVVEENLIRSDFVPRTPPGFMEEVFEMEPGEARVIESEATVILVRLDAVSPPASDGDVAAMRNQLARQADQQLANDIFEIFTADVIRRADPQINQQALQAVHVNFP
jgi:peptidyl-prolyl cis-trans isomerase D